MSATEVEAELLPSGEEVAESLTGFDELAIAAKFKTDISDLSATMTLRALAFVLARRTGTDDKEAYGEAMRATISEITGMFRSTDGDDQGEG